MFNRPKVLGNRTFHLGKEFSLHYLRLLALLDFFFHRYKTVDVIFDISFAGQNTVQSLSY